MASTTTTSERARKRATASRLRAIYKLPRPHTDSIPWYKVFNLSTGAVYKVYRASLSDISTDWRCTCPTAYSQRCKHIQRVLDREEARTKRIELARAASHSALDEDEDYYE